MATDSSVLAWRIPMDRGAWRATVHGVIKSGCDVICFAYGIIDIETVMTYIHVFSKNWYIVCNVKKYIECNVRHSSWEGTQWFCGHNTVPDAISSEYNINI